MSMMNGAREAPAASSRGGAGPLAASVPRLRPHDAHVVLQLLEEIQQLAAPGQVLATESPRLSAAAKLYLDTRDTFEAIEQKVEEHLPERPKLLRKLSKRNSLSASADLGRLSARESPRAADAAAVAAADAADPMADDPVIDRIQDMFRFLGEQLGPAILLELTRRKLTVQAILHYARFLPADCQWEAYKTARTEQVALAFRAPSPSPSPTPSWQRMSETQMLKHRAEFIKEHIRKDVDTVCLFSADGTLSTIFGDDVKADKEQVADKFESLVTDVYSSYLRSVIDAQMEHLTAISDHWQQQMAAARTTEPPFVQYFPRARKYRSKVNIFAKSAFTLEDRLAGVPPLLPGQALHVFVADLQNLGLWWQKLALSVTERDVSTVHTDERRGIVGRVESLDGHIFLPVAADSSSDTTRRQWKGDALSKWIGQSMLVNNGKDSLWVEVRVKDVDEKKCKLELRKSLQRCPDLGSWEQFLALDEWVAVRDLRFMPVPLNPSFRFHMGQKFRDVLGVIQSVIVGISSIFPNDELNRKVANALWRSVEPSVSKGEHIYARYLRSTLNQDVLPRRIVHIRRERASSINASSSVRNLVAAFESSAFGSASGSSLSAPTSGPPTSPAAALGARRVSSSNLATGGGLFDGQGRYQRQQASMRLHAVTSRGLALSPFEKLAHHLLEETEVVGVCLQASNTALGRAFVQVFHERITKLLRSLQARFEREDTSKLEFVLAEYANSCLFQYVWRICRHELDTVPRLARSRKDGGNMHVEWLDRTFERMDKVILDILHQQLHFAHRAFFHECSCYFLPGIYEQAWGSSKPWFGNSRCTYGVQFFIARLQCLMEYISDKLLPMYERTLAVHDRLHDLTWKMDVLYLVCGAHKLLRLLDRMLTPRIVATDDKSKRRPTTEVRRICLRLLASVAIRSGPAEIVLEAVAKKIESRVFEQQIDATAELELHINAIMTSLGLDLSASEHADDGGEWHAHSIFGAMELRNLGDVTLSSDLIAAIEKRHELGNWDFPPLSEHERKHRDALQSFLQLLKAERTRAADEDVASRCEDDEDDPVGRSRDASPAPTTTLERDVQRQLEERAAELEEPSAEDEATPRDSDALASSASHTSGTKLSEQQSTPSATPRARTIDGE